MDLRRLRYFVAVAEERSVIRAAERVCRTQPAVSMALSKLEAEFGAPLFDRSRERRFLLTRAGELLHDYAKRMLELRDEVEEALTQRTSQCC